MSIEIYLEYIGEADRGGIPRAALRALFPIMEDKSETDYLQVCYEEKNSCCIALSAARSNKDKLRSVCVERPCPHPLLWEGILALLRMGPVVAFWPGGPPVVANESVASLLPPT